MSKAPFNFKKINSHLIPAAVTICFFIAIIYFTQFYAQPEQLKQFIHQFGPLGVVAYVISVVLANVAAPISASPLLLLGFSLYGKNAVWLFAIGNIAAMAINFYIARRYGRALLVRLVGNSSVDKIDELSRNYGLFALFLVRMFLSGISDLASYAFGLSPIRFRPYMVVSVIGTLPPYLLLYFFSNQEQTSLQFLLMQLLIAGLLAVIFIIARYLKNRFLRLLLKGT